MRTSPLDRIPRTALRLAVAGFGFMTLVAIGGTAAAATGVLTGAPAAASQGASPSGSSSPSGSASPDRRDRDHDGRGRHYRPGRDGDDGDDGSDGKDGKTGKDGTSRTVYVHEYVTRYLNAGGNSSRVHSGGQVAVYPSGGVATGSE